MKEISAVPFKLSRKWKRQLLLWASSFALGATLKWWLGTETLLVVLLVASVLVAFVREVGVRRARRLEQGVLNYFWNTFRGMIIFAMLPTAWEGLQRLIGQPSSYTVLHLSVTVLIVAIVWGVFGLLPRTWPIGPHRKSRRRRAKARR